MQILEVVLYNAAGQTRSVHFRRGALNVVTGVSGTGKSALLHIVEYCLGRDHPSIPVSAQFDSVQWYGVRLQLTTGQAFVGRPRLPDGRASTSLAMLEMGAILTIPEYSSLRANSNTSTVRERLGRAMGIEENRHLPPPGSLRHPLEAGLGQGALLCFQGQGEVANPGLLFHRQGEDGIGQALKDSLPYFLGAVTADNALRHSELVNARRELRRVTDEFEAASRQVAAVDTQVQGLLEEAFAGGLTEVARAATREQALTLLRVAIERPTRQSTPADPTTSALRQQELEASREPLRAELREVADQRALLMEQARLEQDYEEAIGAQAVRLQPLEIIPGGDANADDSSCPICGSTLAEPDPTVADLQQALRQLRDDLDGVLAARPRREAALRDLDSRTEAASSQLNAVDAAITELRAADQFALTASSAAEEAAYRRGRLASSVDRLRLGDDRLRQREQAVRTARRIVEELEVLLDPEIERAEVASRLSAVALDMGLWANERLHLEHSDQPVRVDLNRLAVVIDTENGSVPLSRVGSAENWVGYHLVAHLALHRYFVRNERPVPNFLMLDQPTQAYYPSEREEETGEFESVDDRAAVLRMFELMLDVAAELSPNLQIIVCDHANLNEAWFQEAVGENNWRNGKALIPAEWYS